MSSYNEQTFEGKAKTKNGARRLVFAGISIIIEILLILLSFNMLSDSYEWIAAGTRLLSLVIVLGLYSQKKTSSMKTPWIILILLLPIAGTVLYLMIGLSGTTRVMRQRYKKIDAELLPYLPDNADVLETLGQKDPAAHSIASYISVFAPYPLYRNTDVSYYPDAADGLEAQLAEMRRAKRFIFMEYHAIENAESWQRIQKVLEERVRAGVEVRVFYDDLGSIFFISRDFARQLESVGIKCRVFNPFIPIVNFFLNNRDHRKITVIDGEVGFTGGYNLANEYFNVTRPFGQWKDTGIKVTGDAVRSLTLMFLEMWNAVKEGDRDDTDYAKYLKPSYESYEASETGFVQPYADSPMDNEHVGEDVYISIIEKAEKYVYFMTPYLILTDEMTHALCLAAKRGVDVRIITPGVPDKKLIYSVSRSFYSNLVTDGVRIFEWTPGFLHAKMCISDDKMATCGTINLDYRSLYHHFENGCFLYGCGAVGDIRADFERTFRESREVTELYKDRKGTTRFWQLILRLFAELL